MPVETRSQIAMQERVLRSGKRIRIASPKEHDGFPSARMVESSRRNVQASQRGTHRVTATGTAQPGPPSHRPRKRPRTTGATYASNEIDVTSRGLVSLPLELLFEILEPLGPLELASLAQTNRSLRKTLMSPCCNEFWDAACDRSEIPEHLPTIPRILWIRTMMLPAKCNKCGELVERGFRPEILRTLCEYCASRRMLPVYPLLRRHPELRTDSDVVMMTLFMTGYAGERFWLEADILSTQAKCMRYKKDIRLKKWRAKKAYEDFKEARFRYVKLVHEHAEKCYEYAEAREKMRRQELRRWHDEIKDRFGKLGYPKSAIEYGMKLPYDRGVINYLNKRIKIHKITDADWQVIRFVHEPDIVLWSCLVLQRFHGNIIDARMKLIESVYDDYKRTLRPIEWLRLPSVAAVCMVPSLRSLVFEDFDTPLDRAQCEETLRGVLPDVISTYRTSVKVLSLRALGETVQLQDGVVNWPAGADDRLALATSVFSRCNEHAISHNGLLALLSEVGTDILHKRSWTVEESISSRLLDARYHCDSDYLPRLDSRGRSIITGLATALGLDPDTARPEDVDALDRRFFCQSETCGSKFVAMSWRDAVFHHGSSRTYCISMLDEASSAAIRANDGRHYSKSKVWSCNHCCAHLNDWQSQAHVVEHVLTVHAVADAMDNVDYFRAAAPLYDYRYTVPLRGEKVSPVDGTYQDIVIECPEDEPRD